MSWLSQETVRPGCTQADSQSRSPIQLAQHALANSTLPAWLAPSLRTLRSYSLDDHDNDPDCFLVYLTAAFEKVKPRLHLHEGILALRQAQQSAASDTLLTFLAIRSISSAIH